MKVGIDAHAAERDGSGNCTYIRNFLKALKEIDRKNEYILYATDINHPFYRYFAYDEQFNIKQISVKNPFLRIPFSLAKESFLDSLDVLHVQYISPPFHRGKLVVTIHDLGFLHFPESFSKFEVFRSKLLIRLTAKKSDRIITGSQYSRDDIIKNYGLDSRKVEVVPYGVSSLFEPEEDSQKTMQILDKYNIQGSYILSVGRLNPRKNLLSLAKAYSVLKEKRSIPHKLVIAGKEDYKTREIIQSIKNINQDVIFTGFVADEDLPYLYNGADVFIYPSLFEGVGLPALEAMGSGVPVITSHTSSLQEIVGDAGMMVNPLDVEEIAQAISRVLSDKDLRDENIKKGLLRAKEFSWRLTAQKTLKIYEDLRALK